MYEEHSMFHRPADSELIWRYLNFAKFVSIVDTSKLYFARVDKLGDDDFEGTLPGGTLVDASACVDVPPEDRPASAERHNKNLAEIARRQRQGLFVSCWHLNQHESDAMWKQYSNAEGVAIQSTFKRLRDSLNHTPQAIEIGQVDYIDYETTQIPPGYAGALAIHKRHAYKHDNELRAIYWDGDEALRVIRGQQEMNSKIGIPIHVDLAALIERIYCSPKSRDWFRGVVESVLDKYGYGQLPVLASAMSRQPVC